jgi:hypothetical protein
MKNIVFWIVTPYGSCEKDVSKERISYTIRLEEASKLTTLAVTIKATPRHITEDGIPQLCLYSPVIFIKPKHIKRHLC